MGQVSRFHVEIDFSGEPLFADFAEEGGDESEQGGFVWKEGSDAGSALHNNPARTKARALRYDIRRPLR